MTVEAQQKVLIEALPPILVLHIKRFYYDTAIGGVAKVSKHVRYGPELEVGSGEYAHITHMPLIVLSYRCHGFHCQENTAYPI